MPQMPKLSRSRHLLKRLNDGTLLNLMSLDDKLFVTQTAYKELQCPSTSQEGTPTWSHQSVYRRLMLAFVMDGLGRFDQEVQVRPGVCPQEC